MSKENENANFASEDYVDNSIDYLEKEMKKIIHGLESRIENLEYQLQTLKGRRNL